MAKDRRSSRTNPLATASRPSGIGVGLPPAPGFAKDRLAEKGGFERRHYGIDAFQSSCRNAHDLSVLLPATAETGPVTSPPLTQNVTATGTQHQCKQALVFRVLVSLRTKSAKGRIASHTISTGYRTIITPTSNFCCAKGGHARVRVSTSARSAGVRLSSSVGPDDGAVPRQHHG